MLPIALTCGDPAGIGLEVSILAWQRRAERALRPFYLIADPKLVDARAKRIGADARIAECGPSECIGVFGRALPVLPLGHDQPDRPGVADAGSAPGVIASIDRAVADVLESRAAALVTAPIAKKTLYDAGFSYPGHTEYLAHLARLEVGEPMEPVMMLAGPELRAVPVTIHIPLADVPRRLTTEAIVATGRTVDRDLRARFGIARPRLAIAGLNPHAGEGGTMGEEEISVIAPAIRALRSAGIDASGPMPADTMFHPAARTGYDAALCMYHDQALIPAKTLAFDDTVNVTLGLPFIRTSPDHGTAFDIAGKGIARPDSMIAALRLAATMASREAASR